MKKYRVFMELSEGWSPIEKYSTDELQDAIEMRDLLAKQDKMHKYTIMQHVVYTPGAVSTEKN